MASPGEPRSCGNRWGNSSRAAPAPGDAIDDIFLGAGRPGDKELELLVDDVMLLGID